jgi:hypothetical protein
MSKIKSFFQSIQKPFQDPINLIKNVAVDVHHEIIQKPFQGLSNQDLSIQSIQKPFQGLSNSIKNVAVVHMHHDQKHPSDLLMHPRRLQADVPVETAQKVVDKALDDGYVEGALLGSGTASAVIGLALCCAARLKLEASAAARAAVAEAEAGVIPATWYGAGAVVNLGSDIAGTLAAGAPVAAAEGVAASVAASAAAPLILPALLVGAGLILTAAAVGYSVTHSSSHSVYGV